jgi:type I restriction enzyme M protein
MVLLLISVDREVLKQKAIVRTVCDPCCGTGGMLTTAKEQILEINPHAEVHMFGHESQPETFALCKADLYMVSADGRDADNIKFGSTLSGWQLADRRYDYQCANPPYGKEWKMDQAAVETEAERGFAGRFGAGLPRISDGQLLFLQHMLARMKDPKDGGGRVAIVMNGSPLFTGDAGSGESEIRRWILENDWLEAIIALPEQLFYNTGIGTYIWVLSNRKEARRRHKVQMIDASKFWVPMRKSLGNKRREISANHIQQVLGLFQSPRNGDHCRIFDTSEFGYRKITVERPLRLNFQASAERLERLKEESAFQNLALSKKKEPKAKAAEEAEGRQQQTALLKALGKLPATLCKDRAQFLPLLDAALKKAGLKVGAPVRKAILAALSERDETAEMCRGEEGQPEADSELRDTENVPLNEDVNAYFDREVKPHVPDAWINTAVRDAKDGEVGKVGYEINFNRYFYQYQPPRPLAEIEAEIKGLEGEIMAMLGEITR